MLSRPERPEPSGPPAPELTIAERRVYRGPNVWSFEQAIHLVVDLGVLEAYPTDTLPGFTDRLLEALPALAEHTCSRGYRGGFVERLREGTWLGHVTEHVALQLQQETGHDMRRGKTRAVKGVPGRYNIVFGYVDERVGLAAGELAVRLVNDLVQHDPEFDWATERESFLRLAARTAFGPSTAAILEEAVSRDIPWTRLNQYSLVQLGQGVHQQRIRATMTSQTSALAVDIAGDKNLTTTLLGSAGLPVPKAETVRSEDGAVRAARWIGYPVVVKPLDGNHGRGVCLNLRSEEEVREAFRVAEAESRRGVVQVESFITGKDYRCLIIDGHMAAIAERVPAHVMGDGEHSVTELVEITNADPRRGVGHEKVLTRIRVDDAAVELVADQGYAMTDIPQKGEMVKLALTGNMSTGGISVDRTFDAHPDNVEIAEEAARVIGLDVAGIDFICPDITAPVRETGGAICEVNAAPGFRMHTHPTVGEPQFIAKPVVDLLFPPGSPSRVPIVAVTGTNGKTSIAEFTRQILKSCGREAASLGTIGIVRPSGAHYGGLTTPDPVALHATLAGLAAEGITHLALEASSHGLDQHRLDGVRLTAAAFNNLGRDHLDYHPTMEAYLAAKLRLWDLLPAGAPAIVNADGPSAAEAIAAAKARGHDVRTTGHAGTDLRLDDVQRAGFRQRLAVVHAGRTFHVDLPLIGTYQAGNALVAAALAMACGETADAVLPSLARITGVVGRLEVVAEFRGGIAVVDYAHKPEALAAALAALRPFVTGKLVCIVGCGGDRDRGKRPIMGRIADEAADMAIVTDDNPRSEDPAAIRAEVLAGAPGAREIGDRAEAIRAGMAMLGAGDVLLVAGKGHETGQIVGDRVQPFSDHEEIERAARELGR